MRRRHLLPAALAGVLCAPACTGLQSSLAPAGRDAAWIASLFWWMVAGAVVVWLATIALAFYYGRPHEGTPDRRRDRMLIVGCGVAIPLVVLTGLLIYGLRMLPPIIARAPEGSLTVDVEGEMWWWRVRYARPGETPVELANEIRLPAGEPVQFRLSSDNVIHSFWIPALGGKMDMIPGRVTYLTLRPERTGIFAGACAEYCGASHALMRFQVEVMERAAFDDWLRHQAAPATISPDTRGADVFTANGCGACHTIRGTGADGRIAPDLTHLASRMTLAAGTLPVSVDALMRWVARAERVKPGVHMPAFDMLPREDLDALARYLESLR